jgi:hypothetical protein
MKKLAVFLLLSVCAVAQEGTPKSLVVNHQPSVSTQATASIGAQDNIRHVADQVCFSAGSTTAPALTQLSVNIRDGATGAGTVLASFIIVIPASTGQNALPFCTALGMQGSNNTAMTAEWSAGLTNLFQQVTLYYHNRPN